MSKEFVSQEPALLIGRYDPPSLFGRIPSLGMQVAPVLAQLDRLLNHDGMLQAVKADLAKRHPQTLMVGRHSTLVEVILCMLVIKHGVPTLPQIAQVETIKARSPLSWRAYAMPR